MKNLRYVCAQPATLYYAWQVEVMINNFIQMGINPNGIDIVCWKQNGVIPEEWNKLSQKYPARFFFYNDTRETKHYISSIRPNILKQHWLAFPELENETILYHDCDILLTKPPTEWITEDMVNDNIWYGSDTRFYISHSYIKGKGQDIMDKMCQIMEIKESVIEDNELNAIGAQYLMKGLNYEFWNRVERDSERLYKEITELNNQKVALNPTYHTLQIWTSDMWAVLWGGWRMGYETKTHPNFDFSWGTSTEMDYHRLNIMHNAGVTDSTSGLFYKAQWMNSLPYNTAEEPKRETASWHYWNEIQKIGNKSCLI
jgi:hypothetical protein